MRQLSLLLPALLAPALLSAQQWEIGASGGYSFTSKVDVSRGSTTGTTGFDPGPVFGGVLANDMFNHIGGEFRYTFINNDLMVSSGGTKATASGQSQALHYDLLLHAVSKSETVRPFFALGAGAKIFRGTGAEVPFQPLANLVVLTRVTQTLPLISAGLGAKVRVSRRALIRFDFRDYLSPFPDKVLATPPSSAASGWIHDFVVQFGVSTVF